MFSAHLKPFHLKTRTKKQFLILVSRKLYIRSTTVIYAMQAYVAYMCIEQVCPRFMWVYIYRMYA